VAKEKERKEGGEREREEEKKENVLKDCEIKLKWHLNGNIHNLIFNEKQEKVMCISDNSINCCVRQQSVPLPKFNITTRLFQF